MGKIISVLFCIIVGIAICGLSMITDTLECSSEKSICKMQSKISGINYTINEKTFHSADIGTAYCNKMYRPARSGKKAYFVLKISVLNTKTEYNLGSYPKYSLCKIALEPIKDFTSGEKDSFNYSSGIGASNILGFILAILMFVVSFVILTNKPETKTYEWEEDED